MFHRAIECVKTRSGASKRGGVLLYGEDKVRSVRTRLFDSSERIIRDSGFSVPA